MVDDDAWPDEGPYWLVNGRTPACFLSDAAAVGLEADADGVVDVDVLIERERIVRVVGRGLCTPSDVRTVDLGGRQVWPMLVDIHTHLDRAHTVARAPNPDGTFAGALAATLADRVRWTHEDLLRRMTFGLRCAYAHGVSAIRTHLDSVPEQAGRSWPVFRELRSAWAGKIDLQAVSLVPIDLYRDDDAGDRLAALVRQSGGMLGAVTRAASGAHGTGLADIEALLDRLFGLAARHDLDIDLHVDETGEPAAATLPLIARAAIHHRYQGRVVCGHCCSLAVQPPDEALRTLDLVAAADIAVVSLPACNMYLQDRVPGRTPRWRGVTLIQEMRSRGIRVAVAGDNVRDCFYAYGDHDMVETFRHAVRTAHLDHPLNEASRLVGPAPADIAALRQHGRLAVGAPARLIVFEASTLNDILSRPQADRVVIDRGVRITERVPGYGELGEQEECP